jgi:hypothetical protein
LNSSTFRHHLLRPIHFDLFAITLEHNQGAGSHDFYTVGWFVQRFQPPKHVLAQGIDSVDALSMAGRASAFDFLFFYFFIF